MRERYTVIITHGSLTAQTHNRESGVSNVSKISQKQGNAPHSPGESVSGGWCAARCGHGRRINASPLSLAMKSAQKRKSRPHRQRAVERASIQSRDMSPAQTSASYRPECDSAGPWSHLGPESELISSLYTSDLFRDCYKGDGGAR